MGLPSDNFTLNGRTQPHYGFNLVPETGVPIGISGFRGIAFATNGAERMRIESGGDVGIGITNPTQALHVKSSSSTQYSAIAVDTSNAIGGGVFDAMQNGTRKGVFGVSGWLKSNTDDDPMIYTVGGKNLRFYIGGSTERMRIDTSGNVGIGTTPQRHLHVHESNSATVGFMLTNAATGAASDSQGFQLKVASDTHAEIAQMENNHIRFLTNASERMRIDSDGMARVRGTDASGALNVFSSIGGSTSANLILGQHSASSITSGTLSFLVYTNGNVVNTNNSYGSLSDAKLKENIVDASSQWEDIKDIRVRNYNFKEETGNETFKQLGVVAQEVETVSPGLVTESPDRDEEGNDLGTVTKSVNYSVLYMKAVKALQEAMDRIETLEAKVAALEAG